MSKSSRDQAEPRPRHARVGDLRYRATPGLAEQLAKRIGHLPDAERVLVDQLYIQGWPAIKVAALTGEPVRVIRRRAHRIAKRVLAEEFRQSAAQHPHWCAQMRRVGEAVFIRGLSARAASRALDLPYRAVMLHARTIRAIARAEADPRAKRGAA